MRTDSPPSTPPDPDADRPAAGPAAADPVEFAVLADAQSAEALSDALLQAGAWSVSVEDAQAPERQQAVFAEPGDEPAALWRLNRLHVLLGPDRSPQQVLEHAAALVGRAAPPIEAVRRIGEQDWVRASQAQFPPLRIGRLWIVPTWTEPPDASALNLRLDPGMAFGTGTHPSTRLCLQWLEANVRPGMRVLDYGCGSGILAIAAAKLGAQTVVGVDIDPAALQVARQNTRRNRVGADYTAPQSFRCSDPSSRFDVVIANILANPLILLAPVLVGLLSDRGSIVLAGVLERQADRLVQAYGAADAGLRLSVWERDGDWVCLAGRRAGG